VLLLQVQANLVLCVGIISWTLAGRGLHAVVTFCAGVSVPLPVLCGVAAAGAGKPCALCRHHRLDPSRPQTQEGVEKAARSRPCQLLAAARWRAQPPCSTY
jgi:hypothetical protein